MVIKSSSKYLNLIPNTNRSGFTIVELLIVIVVIGILAAISIVAYNGIQNRANDTTVRNDLANIGKKFELFKVDHDRFPTNVDEITELQVKPSKSSYFVGSQHPFNVVTCITSGGADYSIAAVSKSGKKYYVSSVGGTRVREYTGSDPWSNSVLPAAMCTSTLPSSTHISFAEGYGAGAWRPWTN